MPTLQEPGAQVTPTSGETPDIVPGGGGAETCVARNLKARNLVSWDHTTKRRRFTMRPRRTATLDYAAGRLVDDGGRAGRTGGRLGQVLDAAGVHRAVLVCDADASAIVRGWAAGAPPDGWAQVGAYASDRAPSVTFRHLESERQVTLATGQQWTGDTIGADATGDVVRRLRAAVEWAWQREGGTLLATPATTGRDLLARTLPESLEEWPVLAPSVADEVRASSGQHRLEILEPGRECSGLVELDARLAYAGVTWGLPVGAPEWRKGEPVEWRGRWRGWCEVTVPDGWTGPGLLPHLDGGWEWPTDPGRSWYAWLDGSEADLARRYGWPVRVLECMEWAKGPDPARTWTSRLTDAYRDTLTAETAHEVEPVVGRAMRAGLRAILLHGIGAMHGATREVSHVAQGAEVAQIPEHALSLSMADDGESVIWTERARPAWPEMVRPEWTATIWARARCRLLDAPGAKVRGRATPRVGALHLPAGVNLLGFRGDALYLDADPHWPDDGAPGRFRPKGGIAGPFTMPDTLADLDALRGRGAARPGDRARAALAEARARL